MTTALHPIAVRRFRPGYKYLKGMIETGTVLYPSKDMLYWY